MTNKRFWTLLLAASAIGIAESNTGSVRGTVVSAGARGELLVVPGATINLSGAASFDVKADESGKYSFAAVPAGPYKIDASAPGLVGNGEVKVVAGAETEVRIELTVEQTQYSLTVSASTEPLPTARNAGNDSLGAKVIDVTPNRADRIDGALPLIPGVVRGPDGLINIKGGRASQNGSLVNGANVSDPVTGNAAIRLPIDVVSSVQVIANPYDPEYGKLTGGVAATETKPGNYEGFHASIQNLFPRPRKRAGDFVGIESVTPRATFTGPLMKDKLAYTQSFEYRYVRTAVPGLPQLERDTKLESFDSFTQLDWIINQKQSTTFSTAIYPQKLDYLGLNTFTPQASTPDLHQRGQMASMQHRLMAGSDSFLISQFSYKRQDADLTAQSDQPYRLLLDTTEGGFFNRQNRETNRTEWQETYNFAPVKMFGVHHLKAGMNYTYASYDGRMRFMPVDIVGGAGSVIQHASYGPATQFNVGQHEGAWFVADKWTLHPRLTVDYGVRLDFDSITGAANAAPRAGAAYDLTKDGKTVLRGGAGLFYDRVVLNVPVFPQFPSRTLTTFDASGNTSVEYRNTIQGDILNPRSTAWNVELDRQVMDRLLVRVAYQQRNTSRDFVLTPVAQTLTLSNSGLNQYREFQVTGRYQIRRHILNASYVRSKAYGDLNDFNQFFGNNPQAVIQPDQRAVLPFDAPNRFVFWGEFAAPRKITISPVIDVHTGFPYSLQNEGREFVGERSGQRFPAFSSVDLQVTKLVKLPMIGKAKVGFSAFNLLNHFNPRDVQNNIDSDHFGGYYNGVGRTFRGKFVVEF